MSLPPSVAQGPRHLPRRIDLCGCVTTGNQRLPLHEAEVYTTIISRTFKTVLKQTFVNSVTSEDGQQYLYRFPTYDGTSVVGFKCKVGSKFLHGFVKEKKQAEAILDAALAKGDTAGILTQIPRVSNAFLMRIGNVPTGVRVLVEITYIGELEQYVDGILFTIPTWIAPSYGLNSPAKHPSAAESVTSPIIDHITPTIEITVDIILPEGQIIKGIESPSHMIAVSIGTISTATQEAPTMNRASTTLSHVTAGLEKEFILAIQSNDTGTPYALLENHPTIPNHRALIVSLVSQFSPPDSLSSPSEIVFVADHSHRIRDDIPSRFRHDIPMLNSALKVFLKSLPTNVKFNICSFGTKNDFLWPQSKDYNSETLQEAMQYIAIFDASYGGKKRFKAIQATIERRLSEMPLEIILLTDGSSRYDAGLFDYVSEQVEKAQGNIRIFCLAIGNASLPAMNEKISRPGNGISQCVQSGERLEASVVHLLRGALSPHVWDTILEVKYDEDDDFELVDKVTDKMEILLSEHEESNTSSPVLGSNNKDMDASQAYYPQIIQAPHGIPGLFANTRTTVYLLMCPRTIHRNPTSITLRNSSSDRSPILDIPIQVLTEKNTTIHQLAARKATQDLEGSGGWMYNQTTSETRILTEKETVRLGETFQITNKWCSFVAVLSSDKEILNKKTFPPNLPDANSTSIIIPRILKPPERKSQPFDIAAIRDSLPNMDRRAMYQRPRGAWLLPPSPSPRLDPSPNKTEPGASSGAQASILPTAANSSGTFKPTDMALHQAITDAVNAKRSNMDRRTIEIKKGGVRLLPPPIPAPPNPNTTKVLALIDLQSFDGSWDANNEILSSILEFEISQPGPPQGINNDVWVTMLVVKFLKDRIPEEKNVWYLVVEKALQYVRAHLHTAGDMASLEEMAGAAVQSS
ncbi:hypothetical protein NHQ30_007900 [Ciborinia camelliae]|nr:hypothetical protein NHQ30_007900 [Ciborinia camelliae]